MAQIEFKDTLTYIRLFIAVLSLCFNVYLAYLLRNKRPRLARVDELREALFAMNCEFEVSEIKNPPFKTDHYEYWTHIFHRLYTMRDASVRCSELSRAAPDEMFPKDVKLAVNQLTDAVKKLYSYRDSFDIFINGKELRPQSPIDKWRNFENPKNALRVLQANYESKVKMLKSWFLYLWGA
jgi:hypothetical protein